MSLVLNGALFANGAVSIAAVGFAACVRGEWRKPAFLCAAALNASWMVSCASYTDYAPHWALNAAGIPATYLDIWSVLNALIGIMALILARGVWWGWALFGLLALAVLNDCVLYEGLKDWRSFSNTADLLFWGEAAIFFVIGGGNAADLIARYARRCRSVLVGRPMEPTQGVRARVW